MRGTVALEKSTQNRVESSFLWIMQGAKRSHSNNVRKRYLATSCFALLRQDAKLYGHMQGRRIFSVVFINSPHLKGFVCMDLDLEGICYLPTIYPFLIFWGVVGFGVLFACLFLNTS